MRKIIFIIISLIVTQALFSQVRMRTAKNCNCKFNTNASFTWNGACKNGYCNGYGTIQWYGKNGKKTGKIVGHVKNGKSEGFCIMYYSDGTKLFEGNFVNDKRNGHGIYYYADGSKYDGEWVDDLKNGKGTMYNSNGAISFQGEFADDNELVEEAESATTLTDIEIQDLLEDFCEDYYSSCFSGRKYIWHSLNVINIEYKENNVIKVTGRHSYKGSYNITYDNMDYYVYITIGTNETTIEFHKKAKADLFHPSDYWEECS